MRIRISVDGAEPLARELEGSAEQLNKPFRPLLEAIAADWGTHFQANIREEGRGGVVWPELHPVTKAIRRHYGYGASSPKLIRRGDLLHSISLLGAGERYIEVGTRLGPARVLQDGGTVTDERGRTRQVQAFPFTYLTEQDVDDTFELIAEYFLGEGDAGA